ncbi:MAG: OsmC family protein [Thermoanaerobaculia bacterium]|nr:OsmC family protein [Thermoanaerobaculia bacterium]
MEARQVNASDGKLSSEVFGEVEVDDGVLVLRRIHVKYSLQADTAQRPTIERVHDMHKKYCPVYRSITPSIDVTTELVLTAAGED